MTLSKDTLDTIILLAEIDTPVSVIRLVQFVNTLSHDQKAELMALTWMGRDGGTYTDRG